MNIQALSLATALAALVSPSQAYASSFFEFSVSAPATGFVLPYCTQAQGPSCATPRPITGEIKSSTFGQYIEEGVNTFNIGQYNASGEYHFTIERRGTQLYGRDIRFGYAPCSAGMCDSTFLSANSFTVSISKGVPEPTTWAMMILGFGVIGYSLRKRQAVKTAVRFA